MNTKRIYSLDFLKFAASLAIVIHNYQGYSLVKCGLPDLDVLKYVVELFFLLSGFFAFDYIGRITDGIVSFREFFGKKLKRLLPMLFLTVLGYDGALYMYYKFLKPRQFKINIWNSVLTALGIGNGWIFPDNSVYINGPTWYISTLLFCLALFYFMTYAAKRLKVSPFYFYCAAVLAGIAFVGKDLDIVFLYERSCRAYYSFFFGVMLGYPIKKRKPTKLLYLLSGLLLVGSVLIYVFDYTRGNTVYFLTYFTFTPLIILFASEPVVKVFDDPVVGMLGAVSFDIYIWQQPVFYFFWSILAATGSSFNYMSPIGVVCGFVLAVAVGFISHFLIEKPINRLIDKYSGKNLFSTPREKTENEAEMVLK